MSNQRALKVGDHIKIVPGYPFNSTLFNTDGEGLPLIRIRDLLQSKIETFFNGDFQVEFLIKDGDILIGMDGDFHIVRWKNKRKALLNQRIMKVAQKKGGLIDISYFYFFLFPFLKDVWDKTTATTVKHLSTYDVSNALIDFPGLTEQRKIAQILTTCDTVIEKTQAAIAKHKAIKQGMLHDLFTRGIDLKTGKLRPKYEDAQELYKESKLGWVPVDWEVEQLSLNIEVINGGTPTTHIKEYWNGEIPWLSVDDFNNSERFVSTAHKKITTEGLKNSSTNLLMPGMIIISARGTVGVISQLKIAMAFNQSCYGLNSINTKIHNDYLYYFLMYYKQDFGFRSFGSVFSTITRDYFDAMFIPFNLNSIEQEIIVNKISTIDQNLSTEEKYMHKLQKLKQGLMGDLLSGSRSVNADSAVNEPADTSTNNVII